ncbi:MAG: adenylate/guanylate cyclase domain-containing protein, partial [Alphaproteobacteria bacterium]|nr:adenylate/guanylate cyclase domain-containing protein [Alphaproteobacteria bacterium]
LIEFASVVDAVRCAVALQAGLARANAAWSPDRRIEFRIGINVGDIVVEDGDIFGDGVNIAARLEALAEPGTICVSARVQEDAAGKLDLAFEDIGEQQLKNIARPVRVYRVHASALTHPGLGAPGSPLSRTAGEGAERSGAGEGSLPLPDKPSLAVLPFQNMTGDAEQEYFVDGMVEEITTAIARLPWLFVIARNSAFTYKGKPVDVKQVAQELGVRYVLEGSVRKAGNRVRITGQLIDTTTGAHIWAERFDGALDDIFELQDQVASNVAGAIEPKLRQSEIERASRKPTANLTAYDLYLRALAQSYRITEAGLAEAVVLARQALAIDPSYAPAAGLVGSCRGAQRIQGWGALSDEDIGEACRLARQALDAERDDAETIGQAAYTLFNLAGEAALAGAALDRALALNPNAAHAWMIRGHIHALRNQPEAAIEAVERARRLSPFDPYTHRCYFVIAAAHLFARRFEQAIEWAARALHDQPRHVPALRVKVAAFAHVGRLDAARAELSRMLAIYPEQTIAGLREYFHMAAPEVVELYVTGLRLAGLPEM